MAAGRPRSFDTDKALDRAMHVFWRKGYDGTSLSDLTRAMGINRPSLYAAFGNKESLFKKALDRYAQGPGGFVREALALPAAREVVERLLMGSADHQSNPRGPKGCLLVQGALSCGDAPEPVRKDTAARCRALDAALRQRLERAVAEGDLPKGTDAEELTTFVVTVIRGMAVQAAGGAGRAELRRVAARALRAWPV
jgi:AcrR family transcriptional regulator